MLTDIYWIGVVVYASVGLVVLFRKTHVALNHSTIAAIGGYVIVTLLWPLALLLTVYMLQREIARLSK